MSEKPTLRRCSGQAFSRKRREVGRPNNPTFPAASEVSSLLDSGPFLQAYPGLPSGAFMCRRFAAGAREAETNSASRADVIELRGELVALSQNIGILHCAARFRAAPFRMTVQFVRAFLVPIAMRSHVPGLDRLGRKSWRTALENPTARVEHVEFGAPADYIDPSRCSG